MASLSERLLKLRPKNASTLGPKNKASQLQEQAKSDARVSDSPSSSKTQVPPSEPATKRKHVEDAECVVPEGDKGPGEVFALPPCYLNCDIFSGDSSLGVHEEERGEVMSEDKETRRKNLLEDVADVMRLLETALMLNDEVTGSQAALDKAYAKINKLKSVNEKLKGDILNHETKFEAQVQLLKDLNKLRPQLNDVTKENECLVTKTKEMEGKVAPVEGETDAEKSMATRGDLIARIRVLEQDIIDSLGYGFNTVMEQLGILNPGVELVVEGTRPFNQVVDGTIFYPSDDSPARDSVGEDEI